MIEKWDSTNRATQNPDFGPLPYRLQKVNHARLGMMENGRTDSKMEGAGCRPSTLVIVIGSWDE